MTHLQPRVFHPLPGFVKPRVLGDAVEHQPLTEPGGSACCYWNGCGTQCNHPARGRHHVDVLLDVLVLQAIVDGADEVPDRMEDWLRLPDIDVMCGLSLDPAAHVKVDALLVTPSSC